MLTTFDDDEYVLRGMKEGASGFLLKDAEPAQIADAVRRAHAGGTVLDPAAARVVVEDWRAAPDRARPEAGDPAQRARLGLLTERERDVLVRVAAGGTNRDIAGQLFVSEATIKTHVHSILTKLELDNRTQLVVFSYQAGLAPDRSTGALPS